MSENSINTDEYIENYLMNIEIFKKSLNLIVNNIMEQVENTFVAGLKLALYEFANKNDDVSLNCKI